MMEVVYQDDIVTFAVEQRDARTYLHTDVTGKPKLSTYRTAMQLFPQMAQLFGQLYTYAPDEHTTKLCQVVGFVPTGYDISVWYDLETEVPEFIFPYDSDFQGRLEQLGLDYLVQVGYEEEDKDTHGALGRLLFDWGNSVESAVDRFNAWAEMANVPPVGIKDNWLHYRGFKVNLSGDEPQKKEIV